MSLSALLATAALASAPVSLPPSTYPTPAEIQPQIAKAQPLPIYRHDVGVLVTFVRPELTNTLCLDPGDYPSPDGVILACTEGDHMILPNPCAYAAANPKDTYALLACHEMGHANGWPGDHPNPTTIDGKRP